MRYSKAKPDEPRRISCKAAAARPGLSSILTCRPDGAFAVPRPKPAGGASAEKGLWETVLRIDPTESILHALAQAAEQRDGQTAGHCERLALIAVALGLALGLDRDHLVALYRGGHLHDLGKVGIPDCILFKPGKLSAEEWKIMRSHPARGEEICRPMQSLQPVLPIIRYHHERWDGSGYPDGLSGDQIPLMARIVQVADIYDALVNPRPYKPGYESTQALRILREETARGWRDPEIVEVFFRLHDNVISQITEYATRRDLSLEALSAALGNLHPKDY